MVIARRALHFVRRTFDGYWFVPGGELSIAICRIAVFLAMLSIHDNIASRINKWSAATVTEMLYPRGVLQFWQLALSPDALDVLVQIAYWATWAAIIGLATRFSMVISVCTHLFLFWYTASFEFKLSHGLNLFFL